jgi:hypothetical protein
VIEIYTNLRTQNIDAPENIWVSKLDRVRIPIEENPNLLLDFRHLEHLKVHLPLSAYKGKNKKEKEELAVHQSPLFLLK